MDYPLGKPVEKRKPTTDVYSLSLPIDIKNKLDNLKPSHNVAALVRHLITNALNNQSLLNQFKNLKK